MGAIEDVTHERESDATEVTAATEASNDLVGIFACHLHLLLSLQADDGLMERHVVEHGAERIFAAGGRRSELDGLRDSCAERAGMVWIARNDILSGARRHRRRALHRSAKGTHEVRAIRLLLHRDLHLIDGSLQSVEFGGVGQGTAPLSGTGLCRDVRVAFLLAVVALWECRVDLVRAEWVRTLVLEVDVGAGAESLLEGVGADERCGAIVSILLLNLFRDVDPGVCLVKLLLRAFEVEDVGEILSLHGLMSLGVQWRERFVRHLCLYVVPLCG